MFGAMVRLWNGIDHTYNNRQRIVRLNSGAVFNVFGKRWCSPEWRIWATVIVNFYIRHFF